MSKSMNSHQRYKTIIKYSLIWNYSYYSIIEWIILIIISISKMCEKSQEIINLKIECLKIY